jgi:hypothetical protein
MANEQKPQPPTKVPGKDEKIVVPVTNNLEALQQIALKPNRGVGSMVPAEALTLQPGLNFVPAEKWAEAAENPHAKLLMEERIPFSKAPQFNPECAGKPYLVVGAPLPRENPLSALDVKAAAAMVEEVFQAKELERLEKVEQRDSVRSAIRQRLVIITKGKSGKAA